MDAFIIETSVGCGLQGIEVLSIRDGNARKGILFGKWLQVRV